MKEGFIFRRSEGVSSAAPTLFACFRGCSAWKRTRKTRRHCARTNALENREERVLDTPSPEHRRLVCRRLRSTEGRDLQRPKTTPEDQAQPRHHAKSAKRRCRSFFRNQAPRENCPMLRARRLRPYCSKRRRPDPRRIRSNASRTTRALLQWLLHTCYLLRNYSH